MNEGSDSEGSEGVLDKMGSLFKEKLSGMKSMFKDKGKDDKA